MALHPKTGEWIYAYKFKDKKRFTFYETLLPLTFLIHCPTTVLSESIARDLWQGAQVTAIWTNRENLKAVTFADLCSDFSGKALMSCVTEVLSSFVTGAPTSSFPKLKREKGGNLLDAYLLGTQIMGFLIQSYKDSWISFTPNYNFMQMGTQAHSG